MASRTESTERDPIACLRGDRPLSRAFQFLGRPWNALLLGSLTLGPTGFRELARSLPGISDSMLSDRLSVLTEVGLIERQVVEGPPVSVTYRLTEHGAAVIPALEQISAWAQDHLSESTCAGHGQRAGRAACDDGQTQPSTSSASSRGSRGK